MAFDPYWFKIGSYVSTGELTNAMHADMVARSIKGRPDSAGTGAPQDLTGTQVGAIVRFGNQLGDSTTTGSVPTYTLAAGTNMVTFNNVSPIIHGMTVPTEIGQLVIIQHIGSGFTTILHESGTAGQSSERFRLGMVTNTGIVISQNQSAVFTYDNRWTMLSAPSSGLNVPRLLGFQAAPFSLYVPCASGGAAGTADDVTVWNAAAPFAMRITDATFRVSTAAVASTVALRTAAAGAGSVVLPDAAAATQTFSSGTVGVFRDAASATATVALNGSLFIRRSDRSVVGELQLVGFRT